MLSQVKQPLSSLGESVVFFSSYIDGSAPNTKEKFIDIFFMANSSSKIYIALSLEKSKTSAI